MQLADIRLSEKASALPLKQTFCEAAELVRYVPGSDLPRLAPRGWLETFAAHANCCSSINNLAGPERWNSRLPEVERHRNCLRRCNRLPEAVRCHSRFPGGCVDVIASWRRSIAGRRGVGVRSRGHIIAICWRIVRKGHRIPLSETHRPGSRL